MLLDRQRDVVIVWALGSKYSAYWKLDSCEPDHNLSPEILGQLWTCTCNASNSRALVPNRQDVKPKIRRHLFADGKINISVE
jgi:hypothetical protein